MSGINLGINKSQSIRTDTGSTEKVPSVAAVEGYLGDLPSLSLSIESLSSISPVVNFKMNDNAANTNIIDSAGNTNGISQRNTSAITVVGKIGTALSFNGSTDKIEFSDAFLPSGAADRSCSFWLKTSYADTLQIVFYYGTQDLTKIFGILTGGDGAVVVTNHGDTVSSTVPINDGQFHHVVVVVESGLWKIYIDGAMNNSGSMVTDTLLTGTATIGIIDGHDHYNGVADIFQIYPIALTDAQVLSLWNSGNGTEGGVPGTNYTTLVAVDNGNGSATIVSDSKIEALDATTPTGLITKSQLESAIAAAETADVNPSQVDVTSSRSLNTVYHNTRSRSIMALIGADCAVTTGVSNTATFKGITDASATPSTAVTASVGIAVGTVETTLNFLCSFLVPPGYYYKATTNTSNGTVTLAKWMEVLF